MAVEGTLLKNLAVGTCTPLPHPELPSESLDDMKDATPNTKNDPIRFMSLKFLSEFTHQEKKYVVEYVSE